MVDIALRIKLSMASRRSEDPKQRPDMDRIFKTITKNGVTNISSSDVQLKIDQMITSSHLKNKTI